MSRNTDRIAMKPYLEKVNELCAPLSREELLGILLELAQDEPTTQRKAFLARLSSAVPGKTMEAQIQEDLPAILEQIEALEEALVERMDAIEDGDYDLLDDWDWDTAGWDDHPDYVSDAQAEDLADFFSTAGAFFKNNDIAGAAVLYGALFDLLDTCSETKHFLLDYELDLREERARYARSIYETAEPAERVAAFADAMDLEASLPFNTLEPRDGFPLLRDVMETRQEKMADFEQFCKEWKDLLAEKGTDGRPASLMAEIVFMLEGSEGLMELARNWGGSQPLGYLHLLEFLEKENKTDEITAVATEALGILKPGSAREKVSQYLERAGEITHSPDLILEGKLQAFYSTLSEPGLRRLLDEAVNQGKRDSILKTTLTHFDSLGETRDKEKNLLLKIQLMAGRLKDAAALVQASGTEPVGWSYGFNVGVFFGAVASVMVGHDKGAGAIKTLLENHAEPDPVYGYHGKPDENVFIRFYDEIIAGLGQTVTREEAVKDHLDWIVRTGRDRIDTIVSNKHRGAYERAALVLAALAEIYTANRRTDEAVRLMQTYCREKYNRFSAFKKEVKSVLASSALLRSNGVGF